MIGLVLNAAEDVLQIVGFQAGQLLGGKDVRTKQSATDLLAQGIADCLAEFGQTPKGIGSIACVTGPGSFTGIRLVLSTTNALRRICHCQTASISYLDALATTVMLAGLIPYGAHVFVFTRARRKLVHAAHFLVADRLVTVEPVQLVSIEAAQHKLTPDAYCLGSAVDAAPELFGKALVLGKIAPSQQALVELARTASYGLGDLEPLYVRRVDAEENLARLATRQGLDAKAAFERYELLLHAKPTSLI